MPTYISGIGVTYQRHCKSIGFCCCFLFFFGPTSFTHRRVFSSLPCHDENELKHVPVADVCSKSPAPLLTLMLLLTCAVCKCAAASQTRTVRPHILIMRLRWKVSGPVHCLGNGRLCRWRQRLCRVMMLSLNWGQFRTDPHRKPYCTSTLTHTQSCRPMICVLYGRKSKKKINKQKIQSELCLQYQRVTDRMQVNCTYLKYLYQIVSAVVYQKKVTLKSLNMHTHFCTG